MTRFLFTLSFLLFIMLPCLRVSAEPFSVDEFRSHLRACSAELESQAESPPVPDESYIGHDDDCSFIGENAEIHTAGGDLFYFDTAYLASVADAIAYEDEAEEKQRLRARLLAMLSALDERLPELAGTDGAPDAAGFTYEDMALKLDEITSRDEFKVKEPLLSKIIPDSWEEWFDNLLKRIPEIDIGVGPVIDLGLIIKILLFSAGIFVIIYILVNVTGDLRGLNSGRAGRGLDAGADAISNPEEIVRNARELAAGGDYRGALRYMYISFVRSIERPGLVSFTETKTNREYIAELAAAVNVSPDLYRMTRMYEDYWYGIRECDHDEYNRFCDLYTGCMRELK